MQNLKQHHGSQLFMYIFNFVGIEVFEKVITKYNQSIKSAVNGAGFKSIHRFYKSVQNVLSWVKMGGVFMQPSL